jgi:hypothetical protein
METQGLTYWAVLPWMLESASARDVAVHNLTRCVYRQVLPDGGQVERIPGYHLGSATWLGDATLLCRLNKWAIPPEMEQRLAAMTRYVPYMTMPDFGMANFGDSSDLDFRSSNAFLSHITGVSLPWPARIAGLHVLYANCPAAHLRRELWPRAKSYPDTGYVCAHSGWDKKSSAIVMHVTGFGGGHTHSDWLSFI